MKEYLRIMFGDWDIMDNSDWDKWTKYSGRTFIVVVNVRQPPKNHQLATSINGKIRKPTPSKTTNGFMRMKY